MRNPQLSHHCDSNVSPPDARLEFKIYSLHDKSRTEVEQYIAQTYAQHFSASFLNLMPTLVCANRPGESAHFFFGIRPANRQRLYLENYLSEPVEQALTRAMRGKFDRRVIDRNSILEIGNMVISDTSTIQDDMTSVALYCHKMGYQHVVCTATRMLRLIFLKLGMKPVFLGAAKQKNAPKDGTQWGKYYESVPQIMGGDVQLSIKLLQRVRKKRQQNKS